MARNTLTQRPFAKYDQQIPTVGTIAIDTRNMREGDVAGLAVFQQPYAYIAVKAEKDKKYLLMVNGKDTIDSVLMEQNKVIYLRTTASNSTRKATFEYSYDNRVFRKLGNELLMQFSLKVFTGNKFCIFNYPTKAIGGFVDIDWMRME